MKPQSYRDLKIYQLAHMLAIKIHMMSLQLPKFKMYEEGSQIRRSAKAIPSNIVEAYARRRYKADFVRFLIYAYASCEETIEHLEILFETKSLKDKQQFDHFFSQYNELGAKMNRFIQSVEKGHRV